MTAKHSRFRWLAALILVLAAGPAAFGQQGAANGEWRHYGGDSGQTKYAPLDQINKDNVSKLKVDWTWTTPDAEVQKTNPRLGAYSFENTPLAIGNKLIVTTPLAQVCAVDATTGETLWTFNPESYKAGRPTNLGFLHRGVAYWTDGREERILHAAHDAKLWALDAKTGKPISDFGDGGKVDLTTAIPLARPALNYTVTSPPVVCRDVVVVGSGISDGASRKEAPRGDIQGFDVRTGKPAWIFHTVPQAGEFGNETWEGDAWKHTGNTNAWSNLSADDELGYVYVPLGTPTNDWYGGHRLGDTLFAESLVCLEAKTGKRVWHFQTVHHGVWDYDLPAAPLLCNLKVDGREIKAVAAPAKTGFLWVFDRTNGKPVWPIEERPVPPSKIPGERLSPTQPFPTKPAPFERQGAFEEDLIDFTPELRAKAKEIFDRFETGPIFTPPSEKGTINMPGWGGGANWFGAAFDPETGMIYIPSSTAPITVKLIKPDASRSPFDWVRGNAPAPNGPDGLPLFKPPWGRVTAIDLNSGDHKWMVPSSDGPRKRVSDIVGRDVGPLGGGNGGIMATKSLLFLCQQGEGGRGMRRGGGDNVLRAFDKKTGELVADVVLPGPPAGGPLTYMLNGKQHVVVTMENNQVASLSLP